MITRTLDQVRQMVAGKLPSLEWGQITISGVTIDSRNVAQGQLYIPIKGDRFDGHQFAKDAIKKGAAACLWQQDKPLPEEGFPVILVPDTEKALQKLAATYAKEVGAKIIGITGSNGKTSTKDILCSILKTTFITHGTAGNLNNQLGVPLTLLAMGQDTEVAVVEMGMSALGDIRLLCEITAPDIAILTNATDVHINDLGSEENILKAKMEIAQGLKKGGLLVHYGDSQPLRTAVQNLKRPILSQSFGEASHNHWVVTFVSQGADGVVFKIGTPSNEATFHIDMLGRHQIFNGAAAVAVARYLGLSDTVIQKSMERIEKTGLRNELMQAEHFHILNDTYKSNAISLQAALETLYSMAGYTQKILVLGDMFGTGDDEIQRHQKLGESFDPEQIDHLFTIGQLGEHFGIGAKTRFPAHRIHHCQTKEQLVDAIIKVLKPGAIVLMKASRIMALEEAAEALMKKGAASVNTIDKDKK
jgi:UDP-N-acetylmuramoyl-tripeptide--D-alanyl-D-alanine ligase